MRILSDRAKAFYNKAIFMAYFGRISNMPLNKQNHFKHLARHWIYPNISGHSVETLSLFKASTFKMGAIGACLFLFRLPFYLATATYKIAATNKQPSFQSSIAEGKEGLNADNIMRFFHIVIPPPLPKNFYRDAERREQREIAAEQAAPPSFRT